MLSQILVGFRSTFKNTEPFIRQILNDGGNQATVGFCGAECSGAASELRNSVADSFAYGGAVSVKADKLEFIWGKNSGDTILIELASYIIKPDEPCGVYVKGAAYYLGASLARAEPTT